jgi:hypothetical protein
MQKLTTNSFQYIAGTTFSLHPFWEFILSWINPKMVLGCQTAKVRIAVLPILDVKIQWNLTPEVLERAFHVRELTREWLQNPQFTAYW